MSQEDIVTDVAYSVLGHARDLIHHTAVTSTQREELTCLCCWT